MNTPTASAWPDGIGPQHVREVAGWHRHASPLPLLVLGAIVALALSGLLGHERDWEAADNGVTLRIHMPETIRNGEFLELRLQVEADEPIGELVVGIDAGLWEDVTVNTMIPAPAEESSEDGEHRFTFASLDAGTTFLLKADAQVNPDIVGGNEGSITIYDGERALVTLPIAMAVLP